VFTLDELILLNKYATPIKRVFLLLAINCGFGHAEIGSLLVGEVSLRQPHEQCFQGVLNLKFSKDDSFIKRIHGKTGVHGEHVLFPQSRRCHRVGTPTPPTHAWVWPKRSALAQRQRARLRPAQQEREPQPANPQSVC